MNFVLLAASGTGEASSQTPFLVMMGLFFVIIYFFMIRPQAKKAKQQRKFLEGLKKGDKVVTNAGIHGRIASEEGSAILLEVDSNTKIKVEKSFVSFEFTRNLNQDQVQVKK